MIRHMKVHRIQSQGWAFGAATTGAAWIQDTVLGRAARVEQKRTIEVVFSYCFSDAVAVGLWSR